MTKRLPTMLICSIAVESRLGYPGKKTASSRTGKQAARGGGGGGGGYRNKNALKVPRAATYTVQVCSKSSSCHVFSRVFDAWLTTMLGVVDRPNP